MPYAKKGLGKGVSALKDSFYQYTIERIFRNDLVFLYGIDKESWGSSFATLSKNKTPQQNQRGSIIYFFSILKFFRY
jgi:hypothetical protein